MSLKVSSYLRAGVAAAALLAGCAEATPHLAVFHHGADEPSQRIQDFDLAEVEAMNQSVHVVFWHEDKNTKLPCPDGLQAANGLVSFLSAFAPPSQVHMYPFDRVWQYVPEAVAQYAKSAAATAKARGQTEIWMKLYFTDVMPIEFGMKPETLNEFFTKAYAGVEQDGVNVRVQVYDQDHHWEGQRFATELDVKTFKPKSLLPLVSPIPNLPEYSAAYIYRKKDDVEPVPHIGFESWGMPQHPSSANADRLLRTLVTDRDSFQRLLDQAGLVGGGVLPLTAFDGEKFEERRRQATISTASDMCILDPSNFDAWLQAGSDFRGGYSPYQVLQEVGVHSKLGFTMATVLSDFLIQNLRSESLGYDPAWAENECSPCEGFLKALDGCVGCSENTMRHMGLVCGEGPAAWQAEATTLDRKFKGLVYPLAAFLQLQQDTFVNLASRDASEQDSFWAGLTDTETLEKLRDLDYAKEKGTLVLDAVDDEVRAMVAEVRRQFDTAAEPVSPAALSPMTWGMTPDKKYQIAVTNMDPAEMGRWMVMKGHPAYANFGTVDDPAVLLLSLSAPGKDKKQLLKATARFFPEPPVFGLAPGHEYIKSIQEDVEALMRKLGRAEGESKSPIAAAFASAQARGTNFEFSKFAVGYATMLWEQVAVGAGGYPEK